MRGSPRAWCAALVRPAVLVALSALALPASLARAEPPGEQADGTIAIDARLEPADLLPGQSGTLVLTARIGHELHVYADGTEALSWRAMPADGVHYDLPEALAALDKGVDWGAFEKAPGGVTWTSPHPYTDPNLEETFPVWNPEHPFELRIPVRLDTVVGPGTTVGVSFDYSACDEMTCYPRVKRQEATLVVGGGQGGVADLFPSDPPAAPAVPGGVPTADGAAVLATAENEAATVTLAVEADAQGDGAAVVTFTPAFGYHLYLPGGENIPISVRPLVEDGIAWESVPLSGFGEEIEHPYVVKVPFRRGAATRMRLEVGWQGCAQVCIAPDSQVLEAGWDGTAWVVAAGSPGTAPPAGTEPVPPVAPTPEVAEGERVLVQASEATPFEVVVGDDLDRPRENGNWRVVEATAAPATSKSWFESLFEKWGYLVLGPVFLVGVLLSLTPCVLPIMPLTISVIGGGDPDLPKRRLAFLLSMYVLGLSLVYGVAGAISGAVGKAVEVEAAFRVPGVIWGMCGFFVLLAIGMLGLIEFQPPAWLERMRGGAQRRSGTIVGSLLLGALSAVIASPCTGPVIVAMLAVTTRTANPFLGFALFFTLGVGIGSVIFLVGFAVKSLLRPGPWMVWVRYFFGIVLVGVAFFYVANGALVSSLGLFTLGFTAALLFWFLISRHLHEREGEEKGPAIQRGFTVALLIVGVTVLVAFLTRPPDPPAGLLRWVVPLGAVGIASWLVLLLAFRKGKELGRGIASVAILLVLLPTAFALSDAGHAGPEGWIKVRDVAHLQAEVTRARREGRAVVVDVWATWCTYCKAYDRVIEKDAYLTQAFHELVRLKIDVTADPRAELRRAVGLPDNQPVMAFFDKDGRIRRSADVLQWFGGDAGAELKRRVDFVLDRVPRDQARSGR